MMLALILILLFLNIKVKKLDKTTATPAKEIFFANFSQLGGTST